MLDGCDSNIRTLLDLFILLQFFDYTVKHKLIGNINYIFPSGRPVREREINGQSHNNLTNFFKCHLQFLWNSHRNIMVCQYSVFFVPCFVFVYLVITRTESLNNLKKVENYVFISFLTLVVTWDNIVILNFKNRSANKVAAKTMKKLEPGNVKVKLRTPENGFKGQKS